MDFEKRFWHVDCSGATLVMVNMNTFNEVSEHRGKLFANMEQKLKEIVPFGYEQDSEFVHGEIKGSNRDGSLYVHMLIKYARSKSEIDELLTSSNFCSSLPPGAIMIPDNKDYGECIHSEDTCFTCKTREVG